jgi:subtilisin family serine protease
MEVVSNTSERKVRVVVIDSGIDVNQYDLKHNVLENIGIIVNDEGNIEKKSNTPIENEHGTLIAACIKYIYSDIELVDINILDKNLNGNGEVFIKALKESIKYDPDIINLSLGTTKLKYWVRLALIVRKLRKKGIIVVAAADNSGTKSYPACLKGAIGVKGNKVEEYKTYRYDGKFYYAYGRLPKELCKKKQHYNIHGNSIACAYITGHVCKSINNFK